MSGAGNRPSSMLAALVLTAITLGVFYVVRDYGPESAIRRFQFAVVSKDPGTLQAVTQEQIGTSSVQHLISSVELLEQRGANYQILRMDRQATFAVAVVQYTLADNETGTTSWVVVKEDRTWRVDASDTGAYFRRTLGL